MAKKPKTFDKDLMYKKIMPTNLRKSPEASEQEVETALEDSIKSMEEEGTHKLHPLQNKKNIPSKPEKGDVILYNAMEKLVTEKLDATLRKMNCCRCDRCKEDIVALSLNKLEPRYIVATREEIDSKISELDNLGLEVTTAILKSVLTVRKNPRH
jgi:hypothetical protein